MGMTDPISDMLTRIRNAQAVRKDYVDIPKSRIKMRIAEILLEEGYVTGVEELPSEAAQQYFRVVLKYHNGRAVIEEIKRSSKPGRRLYVGWGAIPRVYQGLGISILSTNKGLLSNRNARKMGVGGELICTVF
ncbi:30S ribosomal protein S8 [Candidatus Magnetaquicoccus inordinatus]|uniref:30S ribosomal protein S8 n=1 Tax=Candidatus Magnetaquicoccus inordinatus TaxID=2496818 RepID=UPI00102B55F0|nr:30S ribosomal protein S8 [Candidatus Magnetaquicoccus inordinatus]